MCLQDWQIARRATVKAQVITTSLTLGQDPLRLSLAVACNDSATAFAVYAGTDATGIPLAEVDSSIGTPGRVVLTLGELGPLITGPLFVQTISPGRLGVVELISGPQLETLFQKGM